MDYDEGSDYLKYKLYIKDIEDFYKALITMFSSLGYADTSKLIQKVKCVCKWNEKHNEFKCIGVAIGVDKTGAFTVNFYFQYDEALFN